jgi:alpha-N-arabinofuranosidase
MRVAQGILHSNEPIVRIDPRIYGSFIEHLGRCVYGGIYQPNHPSADTSGFRMDVLDLVREIDVPIVRYPGGNFVSSYRWEDGVGPRAERPRRLELAWRVTETNEIGLNEFVDWCQEAKTEPMLAVNLGTRGMEDAVRLLEYANHPGGTELSDRRIAHGYREPHGIRTVCLGNEMDGPWQAGHKSAVEYGRLAAQTAQLLHQFQPDLELVLCGSSGVSMPTFPEWDRVTLELAYEQVDLISLHLYLSSNKGTTQDFLASALTMDQQIRAVIATADYVRAVRRSKKPVNLCFDEYNVWDFGVNEPGFAPWQVAPPQVEQIYNQRAAIVFGSMMLTLLRHAERVRVACVAQLVNVIAPIMAPETGAAFRQSIFFPYAQASRHARGQLLPLTIKSPVYDSVHGPAPLVDGIATLEEDESMTLLCLNRSEDEAVGLSVRLTSERTYRVLEHRVLEHDDPTAANSSDTKDLLLPHARGDARVEAGRLEARLGKLSWHLIRLVRVEG